MKKVLLTSAVVLATFGATQAVSADIVDFNSILSGITDTNAKAKVKAKAEELRDFQYNLLNKQQFGGKTLRELYINYVAKEAAYKALPETVKAAYANLEALRQEQIKIEDMKGDANALASKVAELDVAITNATHKVGIIADEIKDIKASLGVANDKVAELRAKKLDLELQYSSAVKAAESAGAKVDAEINNELQKVNNDYAAAVKKANELNEQLSEKVAEQKENAFNIGRYNAAKAAVVAYMAGDQSKILEASFDLDKKVEAAKEAVRAAEASIETARAERDAAKNALETAETMVSEKFADKGLTYNRSVFEVADTNVNNTKVGWYKNHAGMWAYYSTAGDKATGWKQVDGTWYYFNAAGEMQKFWVKDGNTWYYLNGSGELVTGWLQDGGKWYFLDASGAMKASQWIQNNGSWYYLDATGAMKANGWFQVGDKWYYATASGAIAVNTTVGGYTVNGNGEWVK